ncbi:MAG: hypothetical protein K0R38_6308 [Polyangiaceae bacterium]|jgi:hypothetical protein|nr:hypothetical protein [Polyangiaceae bacterium]
METNAPLGVSGFEFDWLASDADGCVALFSTAGGGFAPMSFLRDPDAHQVAIDELLAAPASTTVRFAPEFPAAPQNTWRLVAERGLYAYDSDAQGGAYRLLAAPSVPARVADLPAAAREVAGSIRFQHLRFSELTSVPPELLQSWGAPGRATRSDPETER